MRKFYIILVFISLSVSVTANTINVGGKSPVKSIKKAISLALSGDTILVAPGYYKEGNIIIYKKVLLKGLNYPVLDGEKKFEIISIKANDVVVEGFKLIRAGASDIEDYAGIKVYHCSGAVIQKNILDDTHFGIYIQYGKKCVVRNNKVYAYNIEEQQSGNGIHCWKSDSLIISDNEVTGHRDGIYFEFVTNSEIYRNKTTKNIRYGLHFMFSNNDIYVANTFLDNGAGVAVMYSHGVTMVNNHFLENWGDAAYGLLLKEISDSHIKGNIFEKNTTGIFMEGVSRIQVNNNSFLNNGWGMKIQASCMDINVTRNNFIGNTFDVGTNGSLVLNKFNYNYWDKYEGYDNNKNKIGDIPYRPISMYSMIIEKYPAAMMLFRSFITSLMDKTEKIIPSITPENLKDDYPLMRKAF
jgi:nitrous oxidase accessory protein